MLHSNTGLGLLIQKSYLSLSQHSHGCCWRHWQPGEEKHGSFGGDWGKIQLHCEIITGLSSMPSSSCESPRLHMGSFAFTFGRKREGTECILPFSLHSCPQLESSLYCIHSTESCSELHPHHPIMASLAAMDFVFSLTSFRIAFWFIPNKRESRSA